MSASTFVTLAPDEQRIREYHVVEQTDRFSAADAIALVVTLLLLAGGVLLVAKGGTGIAMAFGCALVIPFVLFAIQLVVRPQVSEVLTITNERVVHYRREHGRFHDGHAYQNVRVRDISGVTCSHDHSLGGEQITIFVHTARADAMLVGAGRGKRLLSRFLQRQNMGPDAVRALGELPSLLPALRAGEPV